MTDEKNIARLALEIAGSCPAMRSRALARAVARVFDEALRPHGIKSSQFAVLVAIGALGQCRPMDIAAELLLSRAAVTRAINVLESRKWIQSTEKAARMRTLELTATGKNLLVQAESQWRMAVERVGKSVEVLPDPRSIDAL
ncbi:MAG: MarR family winged helix-turn-helix transcriptional regulator [Pseudomonadota bacterium]